MQKDLETLIAYVGAFNVLIHMRETSRSLHLETTVGPDRNARELARSGRAIAQEAIVKACQNEEDATGEVALDLFNALKALGSIKSALLAMDTGENFKITAILDCVQ